MAMELRYMGEFLSREGVAWRVEIRQEAPAPFEEVGALTFEANQALTIEWTEKKKEEVVCGSVATIQIESPGDRTYEDLYTIEVGQIRMDAYREGRLYWSGMLDPEFYEEPYERAANYEVSLTFSDFGILQRKKYALAGMRTIQEVLEMCMREAGFIHTGIDQTLISTGLYGSTPLQLSDIKIRSDNFYDEDGEASTLEDVLTGIFQPLGLRLVQRCGKIYVYDLNGLYSKAKTAEAIWSGDSSTMGVDVVYNNAKITWSTYAQSGNLAPTECWPHKVDPNLVNINSTDYKTYEGSKYISYHYSTDLSDWIDATDAGFTLWLNKQGNNAELAADLNCEFFKTVPQYDGSEAEGIMLLHPLVRAYKVGDSKNWHAEAFHRRTGINPAYMQGNAATIDRHIFKSAHVWIPPADNPNDLLIRISLEMLLDPRWNPFEQGTNFMKYLEQEDWQKQWKKRGNFLYVPVTIKFKPDGSDKTYCWDNRQICKQSVKAPVRNLYGTYGSWANYDTAKDDKPDVWGWLCYYDVSDRKENSGVANGWAKNRPAINPHTEQVASILANSDAGQYIPYPAQGGGELWVEVRLDGWMISDGGDDLSETKIIDSYGLFNGDEWRSPKVNWILCKLPEIEIVNNVQFEKEISTDDVEYSAQLNEKAKDALEIDTVCGTKAGGVPTARGAYFNASNGKQITELSRAGRRAQAEQLLIGTLYSQYAERRTKLSGEIELHPDALVTYTEQNQEGKKFILTGETQDCITDTTQATIIELRPDEYDRQ